MTAAFFILLAASTLAAAYAVHRFEAAREQAEQLRRELRHRRLDAQSMALHLRAADRRGYRLDDECRGAMGRALAWCPATPTERHRVDGRGRCTACGLGQLEEGGEP